MNEHSWEEFYKIMTMFFRYIPYYRVLHEAWERFICLFLSPDPLFRLQQTFVEKYKIHNFFC